MWTKKIFNFLLTSFFLQNVYSQDTIKIYYPDSVLKKVCFFDSSETGVCKIFYQNSSLNVIQNFQNGELEGAQMTFHLSGSIQSLENYNQGSLQDTAYYFYESGVMHRKGTFRNDTYFGYWKTYYENATIKQEGNYLNGEPHGIWQFYDQRGRLETQVNYLNGKKHGEYISFYVKNGRIKEQRFYDSDIESPCRKYFKKSGAIKSTVCN